MNNEILEMVDRHRVWYCMDCGKCGAVCPITRWEQRTFTSPRLLIEKSIHGRVEEALDDPLFWSCLACKRCTELCPSDVHFTEFLRDARQLAHSSNRNGDCTHSEMIQTWAQIMTRPDLHQNRLGWLEDSLHVSQDSDTVFFVGCLPYFDAMFTNLDFEGVKVAQAAVKVLNALGIQPQVLADEVCCGRDQLWEGDIETFRSLAELNLQKLKETGAKRIVSTCPECVRTLKIDYPELVGPHNMEVVHLSEILAEQPLSLQSRPNRLVTFQDPCNLGRHLGIYQQPRQVLSDMGFELVEMERNKNASLCCGTGCWRSCGQVSKSIQVERLEEARSTGAELLVTACIKCQIHFRCAQNDPILKDKIKIPIQDLTTLAADAIG